MRYRILLVEDDVQIREVIEDYFSGRTEDEVSVVSAGDVDEGMERIAEGQFDLAIFDIMLPGASDAGGFDLCRELRKDSVVPVIFLTARGQEEDKLYGYMLGCDDYIVKPFSLALLYAKVKALVKRARGMVGGNDIRVGKIRLIPEQNLAYAEGRKLTLSPKEFALLQYLMEHPRQVLSREKLLIQVWGYEFEGMDRVVDNHIRKLRKKLGKCRVQIKTVIKKGYRMEEEQEHARE